MTDIDIVDELRDYAAILSPDLGGATILLDAADEIEQFRNQVDSMQMANDMLRATHKTDNQYLLDEIERLRGESDWEYGVRNLTSGEVFEPVNGKWWRTTDNEESVRRHPATEWERVPEGEGDG